MSVSAHDLPRSPSQMFKSACEHREIAETHRRNAERFALIPGDVRGDNPSSDNQRHHLVMATIHDCTAEVLEAIVSTTAPR